MGAAIADWFANLPDAPAVAWWGAVISTVLLFVKGFELWRDRFQITVGGTFTSSEEIGHTILIRNMSGKAQLLEYWEVFYGSGVWPFRKEVSAGSREFDSEDAVIQSRSSLPLYFSGPHYFSTNAKAMHGRALYVRLHFVGHRPILRKVYSL